MVDPNLGDDVRLAGLPIRWFPNFICDIRFPDCSVSLRAAVFLVQQVLIAREGLLVVRDIVLVAAITIQRQRDAMNLVMLQKANAQVLIFMQPKFLVVHASSMRCSMRNMMPQQSALPYSSWSRSLLRYLKRVDSHTPPASMYGFSARNRLRTLTYSACT